MQYFLAWLAITALYLIWNYAAHKDEEDQDMNIHNSGWIINFKNGHRVIFSEKAYQRYQEETPKEDVLIEEHWFILDKAIEQNPDLDLIKE